MKNKRGELTTQQLVGLVILILSFAVLIFFIARMNLGETTKKEICKNSLVLFDKSKIGGRLDCETSYVCISGGEKCDEIVADETIKVDPNNQNEIMGAIAKQMADCWWIFGEGKIEYVEKTNFDAECAICSIIKFDKTIQGAITKDQFIEYLTNENKDESQKYLKYLYGIYTPNELKESGKDYLISEKIDFGSLERYAILTGFNRELRTNRFIFPSIVKVSEISSSGLCEAFDVTKS